MGINFIVSASFSREDKIATVSYIYIVKQTSGWPNGQCLKFKRFRGHRKRAETWLSEVKKREPKLVAHWQYRNRNIVTS